MYSEKRKFGNIGEDIVVKNLLHKGYEIVERNYLKKYGEIDIVARGTDNIIRFFEVKTIEKPTSEMISHETWAPEDNVHPQKLRRLHRVIQVWIEENKYEGEWQIDVACVEIDTLKRLGRVRYIENIV